MNRIQTTTSLLMAFALGASSASAVTITGATTQNAGANFTTTDGLLTLSAFNSTNPDVAGVFNTGDFGIGVSGTNEAALNNTQAIDWAFGSTVGLSQLQFQFSRVNGPLATDGLRIAGFLSDPGATDGGSFFEDVRWDEGSKSVFVEIGTYDGTARILNFASPFQSAGQTLRMNMLDSDLADPQVAITSMSYDVIPEPSGIALLLVSGLGLTLRRRR